MENEDDVYFEYLATILSPEEVKEIKDIQETEAVETANANFEFTVTPTSGHIFNMTLAEFEAVLTRWTLEGTVIPDDPEEAADLIETAVRKGKMIRNKHLEGKE